MLFYGATMFCHFIYPLVGFFCRPNLLFEFAAVEIYFNLFSVETQAVDSEKTAQTVLPFWTLNG